MFSVRQKREIADGVQKILCDTQHPKLPQGEITFSLHVDGAESWSWADTRNNGAVTDPGVNEHNEIMDCLVRRCFECRYYSDGECYKLFDAVSVHCDCEGPIGGMRVAKNFCCMFYTLKDRR